MNQKKKIKLIATVIITVIVLIMIILAGTDKIKKNKLTKNELNALNNGSVTTIDITGITPSPESQHEHIYKTLYDETKHWEECIVCGLKRNEQTHSLMTTWATGKESCEKNNYYTRTCSCSYSEIGHKPCVWDGKSYLSTTVNEHYRKCSICADHIEWSYYLNSYGKGNLYEITEENMTEQCKNSNDRTISCSNLGTCSKCEKTFYGHVYYGQNEKIVCQCCSKEFGTYSNRITRDSNVPATYTVDTDIILTNGLQWYNYGGMRSAGNAWQINNQTDLGGSNYEFALRSTGKFNNNWETEYINYIYFMVTDLTGKASMLILEFNNGEETFYPDSKPPKINNISVDNNSWNKSKSIIISGTENWTNTVNIEIKNNEGNIVYKGKVNVDYSSDTTYGTWLFSCTPEIEVGENNETFKVTVTDACENSTTMDFNISKIDGRPPTVTSSDKVTDSEWAKEKTFTFTAEDLGIGNVEIGFNDVADYSPAIKDGTNYSKEYKFVGDAYSPVQASVYFKDGLGNITTQVVTLEKIDNTAPSITNASLNNNVVSVTAHDRHSNLGEGSGVVKYRYITSVEKLENPEITENNSQEIDKDTELKIPNISEVKYIYVVAEDLVGNTSESYEIEVPQLVLTSRVSDQDTIILDWTGYDKANKYFVIYSKQEGEEEWKTVVGIDEKLNSNTYTLGNDISKPEVPQITMERDIEAGQIKVNQTATDNGTTYTYYIEAYDQNTGVLIAVSNIN